MAGNDLLGLRVKWRRLTGRKQMGQQAKSQVSYWGWLADRGNARMNWEAREMAKAVLTLYDLRPDGVELLSREGITGTYDPARQVKWWVALNALGPYRFAVPLKTETGVVLVDYAIPDFEARTPNVPPELSGVPQVGEWPLPIDRNKLAAAEMKGYRLALNHMSAIALLPPVAQSSEQRVEALVIRGEAAAARMENAVARMEKALAQAAPKKK